MKLPSRLPLGAIAALCVAVFVAQLAPLVLLLKPFAVLPLIRNDSACALVGNDALANAEDLTMYWWGLVLVSAGNLLPLIGHSPLGAIANGDLRTAGVADGGIWLLDVRRALASGVTDGTSAPELFPVPIRGMPAELEFHPHGIFYSNATGVTLRLSTHSDHSQARIVANTDHFQLSQARVVVLTNTRFFC